MIGLGGLGHLGIQFAARSGFNTVAIGRGKDKEALAKKLGASHYIDSAAQDPAAELLKLGGAKVALVCVFIEAAGLALIWFASNPVLAAAGAALTGFGYSLVYPGLGVEAVRSAPPQSRGLAMGAYTVFLDAALGFGSPALGLVAGWTGLGSVFLASAILVLCAAVIAAWLLRKNSLKEKQS